MEAVPVNGETVIRGQRNIFGAAPVLLAVVPVLMTARAAPSFGLAERAAELLAGSAIVGGLSVLVHGESGIAKKITCGYLLRVLCSPLIQRNNSIAFIDVFYEVVDCFRIVTLVAQESTFPERQYGIGGTEDIGNHGNIRYIGRRG